MGSSRGLSESKSVCVRRVDVGGMRCGAVIGWLKGLGFWVQRVGGRERSVWDRVEKRRVGNGGVEDES